MNAYYVNKNPQANGDHEVHKEGCTFMPSLENRKYLGLFFGCRAAIAEAKRPIRSRTVVTIVQMIVILRNQLLSSSLNINYLYILNLDR